MAMTTISPGGARGPPQTEQEIEPLQFKQGEERETCEEQHDREGSGSDERAINTRHALRLGGSSPFALFRIPLGPYPPYSRRRKGVRESRRITATMH